MSLLRRPIENPKKVRSILNIQGLPTRENDPNGPEHDIDVRKWRNQTLQVTVWRQKALNRLKRLSLPKPLDIQLCTSSQGDGKLYVGMFFSLENWAQFKDTLVLGGFLYDNPFKIESSRSSAPMGFFSLSL